MIISLSCQHFQESFVIERVCEREDPPEDSLTFEMKNIATPLANAIRRIMIAEVCLADTLVPGKANKWREIVLWVACVCINIYNLTGMRCLAHQPPATFYQRCQRSPSKLCGWSTIILWCRHVLSMFAWTSLRPLDSLCVPFPATAQYFDPDIELWHASQSPSQPSYEVTHNKSPPITCFLSPLYQGRDVSASTRTHPDQGWPQIFDV